MDASPEPADAAVHALLTEGEVEQFRSRGFARVSRPIVRATEVAEVRAKLDALFAKATELPPGHLHDLNASGGGRVNPEIVEAGVLDPSLLRTAAYKRCRSIAEQVLGGRVLLDFDHAIFKPARCGGATGWHQDLAFNEGADRPFATVWLALAPATVENGCMQFIPGRPSLLPHERVGRDGLQAVAVDEGAAEACELPAGGVTVHDQHTLHTTGPNDSDLVRAAWILKFTVDDRSSAARRFKAARMLLWSALPKQVRYRAREKKSAGPHDSRPTWAQGPQET